MSGAELTGRSLYLLLLVLISSGAHANTEPPDSFVSIQTENDLFARSGDRYYTNGLQLSILKKEPPPAWLAKIAEWTPFYQQGSGLNLVQYTVGQKIFTPNDTETSTVVADDRPYAGYLYFGATLMSHISHSENFDYGNLFEMTIGVVGPSALGEQAQTFVHDLIGIDSPNGWDNQLEDELALGLSYSRFWRLIQPVAYGLEFGINPQISAAVGNVYTYGAGGVMFRLGDNLRRDLSPPNIRPGFPGVTYFQASNRSSWYFYLGFESRLMFRDISLDGNTFTDSHSVDKERLVGDMQYGIVYIFDDVRIAVSNMTRTDEFTTQEKVTRYGAINLSFRY